jgi:hypothetical protein
VVLSQNVAMVRHELRRFIRRGVESRDVDPARELQEAVQYGRVALSERQDQRFTTIAGSERWCRLVAINCIQRNAQRTEASHDREAGKLAVHYYYGRRCIESGHRSIRMRDR